MKRILAAIALVATGAAAGAFAEEDAWGKILAARVTPLGEVAYRALAREDAQRLSAYLDSLSATNVSSFDHDHAVAFWLNAYHAMVVAAVTHGERPDTLSSRAKMYHWFGHTIAGSRRTLDGIWAILNRYASADPRIHLAICNGTRGGPRQIREPYDADRLDAQLAAATRRFLDDPEKSRIDDSGRIGVSRVFEWYRSDFDREAGSLLAFLRSYATRMDLVRALGAESPVITYGPFDWSLDAAPDERPK